MSMFIGASIFLTAQTCLTSASEARPQPLTDVPIQQVVVDDEFWSPKLKVWREVTIPDCFTKFENERDGATQ